MQSAHQKTAPFSFNAYDFDQNGYLVPFDVGQKIVDFPLTQEQKERYQKSGLKEGLTKINPKDIETDASRDCLLTDFGKAVLEDRYLLKGETYQDMFARVSAAFADNLDHAKRLYDYMSKLWFMPSTPILSNGGAKRGLPISCFLNTVEDNLDGIVTTWNENVWLASNGGGIGTYWGDVRSLGEPVGRAGDSSGIIPFIRVMDSQTLAISQGSLRRGSAAVYLDVHHPEIEEFIDIRKPSGDFNRKSLNLHHGVNITDDFMEAVKDGKKFDLKSPKTKKGVKTVDARQLFQKILETRIQTGEPYLVFVDTANKHLPKHQRDLGLKVKMSNLCSEILLPTGKDHLGNDRTAVCCLSSLNVEKWDEWQDHPKIIEDILRFLDNVLETYIQDAPESMNRAKYSAQRERSVGLGIMGFHSFLQSKQIPFESALAKSWNKKVFKHIRQFADRASVLLAEEKGACLDAKEKNIKARFSNKIAIAPTASISIICGGTSAGIEPIPANIYNHKTLSGNFVVKNPHLETLLKDKEKNTDDVWQSIVEHEGSVAHLDFLNDYEKATFKTAFELDQRWLIELAANRTPFICQGQSLNLFLNSDIHKWDLLMLHWKAWQLGVKSLYYCRSKSIQRAEKAGKNESASKKELTAQTTNYEECLACQ
ncbi:MAG: ribonucleoside-diphosphate reductase subunit alpha [Proteobacteria bacterium]|nr:ribonucleoside-diphosphate reductase subunit alpha [Pseudomonadota bacterium]